jgi:LuxR family maltose regulon positive regulatory protein
MASTIIGPAVRYPVTDGRPRLGHDELPAQQLVGDKLRVPQPCVNILPRSRVTELLRHAAGQRITLVCGPAGAGKTVACATWATAAAVAGRIAWLSLDPADREPGRLWTQVRAALATAPAIPSDLTKDLRDVAPEAFSVRLVEAAERLTTPVTLVLDDIQELAGSGALPGLDFLVRHGPPALRLLLCGRYPAGLPVARLRVGGELAEVGAADLACTAQEADDYFTMLGIDVPAAERDELLARTEGWMTGLRLATLRTGPDRSASQMAGITGDDPAVADYLWDEVLATQPAGRRLFLLRTSIVDRVCGDLADALTGADNGAAVLDQLARENMLVRAADRASPDDTAGYRYHPLLRDLLRAQLRRELPGEVSQLARRAARWQAAHGCQADAIRHAAEAGDWDFAARVLSEAGPALLLPGQAAGVEPLLALFPAGRRESDAALAASLASASLRAGDCAATAAHLAAAAAALGRCAPGQRRAVGAWLQALRLLHAIAAGPPQAQAEAGTELIEQSLALAGQATMTPGSTADQQALGLLWYAVGLAQLARRDITGAREALGRASSQLTGGHPGFRGRAIGWQAVAHARAGELTSASDLISDLRDEADWSADPVLRRLTDLAAADVSWARDDLGGARRLLSLVQDVEADPVPGRQDCTVADRTADQLIGWLADAARARLELSDNDLGAARSVITRLRYQRADPGSDPGLTAPVTLDPDLAALDADIALAEGDPGRARLALARAGEASCYSRAALLLAQARTLLADGDSRGALAAIEPCLDGTASQLTLHSQISALVTVAVACRRLGQADRGTEHLARALALAEPHGAYRAFLDGGPAARSALTVLIRPASPGAALAARILQRFDTCPARQADQPDTGSVALTGSELAVLRFLPSHMTNQEIAEALFLSINTVKTHLRSVYRKLGVTARRQAISRGRRLGLL